MRPFTWSELVPQGEKPLAGGMGVVVRALHVSDAELRDKLLEDVASRFIATWCERRALMRVGLLDKAYADEHGVVLQELQHRGTVAA